MALKYFIILFESLHICWILIGGVASMSITSTRNTPEYTVHVKELVLPNNILTENTIESWCVSGKCRISPRTYFHQVTTKLSLVGFTDLSGQGHILLIDQSNTIFDHVQTKVHDQPMMVAGVFGFYDQSFAVTLYKNSSDTSAKKMYIQLYRPDRSIQWTTLLNSDISVPDRNVGDFRMSYGNGFFIVYFSVYGIDNFANATNGEQVSFVDDGGNLKTTSFPIPGQEHVKTGDDWGCSHSLAQLVNYHSIDNQFIIVCSADLYPKGISLGDSQSGTLIYRSYGNGKGITSAQLGQIAEANTGWKLVFNAEDTECCPGSGIGFTTIYNEKNTVTSKQQIDPITWITRSNGSHERDPVIARIYLGNLTDTRETYILGWLDILSNEYNVEIINTFGTPILKESKLSNIADGLINFTNCNNSCLKWGNRDDSFHTLRNGNVGWIAAPPKSSSIWLHTILMADEPRSGWSLWSGWAQCSHSCAGGFKTRVRTCLTEPCVGIKLESMRCNTAECKIPIKCNFKRNVGWTLKGDLFVNGVRQFAFTRASAEQKCAQFNGLCQGITKMISGGYFFFILKTSQALKRDDKGITYVMTCQETPGWTQWSTWNSCSLTCGGGLHSRSRICDGEVPGSEVCKGPEQEVKTCNTEDCATWTKWSTWSKCSRSCNTGHQVRERQCNVTDIVRCSALTGPDSEIQVCSLGICGRWLEWSQWTSCSTTCGDGYQERTRDCIGDFVCDNDGLEGMNKTFCNLGLCPTWSLWTTWSLCSKTCGNGTTTRRRQCKGSTIDNCKRQEAVGEMNDTMGISTTELLVENNSELEISTCSDGRCSVWLDWGPWSTCSATCNKGTQSRRRKCLKDFDLKCNAPGRSFETQACTLGQCGKWSSWIAWSQCSETCGSGVSSRSRFCFGDFPSTCIGEENETQHCDVTDCVVECIPNPCKNNGECRKNDMLTRWYQCNCKPGWMGKHCDFRGPELTCGSNNIIITFDRRAIAEEGMLTQNPSMVGFISRDSSHCIAMFEHSHNMSRYFLMIPKPIETSCGSTTQVTSQTYQIQNSVTWEVMDETIKSTVVLFDFTCIYEKNGTSSSEFSSNGILSIESYKRQTEVITSGGTFDINLSLFRDALFQKLILPPTKSLSSLITLAEGEVLFVSVDLQSKDLFSSNTLVLVIDTCFVTSSQRLLEPITFLLQESCPVSKLVNIISNGDSQSGRFSVRVFGWTKTAVRRENVYIHCMASVCDSENSTCIPNCNTGRQKRAIHDNKSWNQKDRMVILNTTHTAVKSGQLFPSVVQSISIQNNSFTTINSSTPKFNGDKMVSLGPFNIIVQLVKSKKKRSVHNMQSAKYEKPVVKLHFYFKVLCVLALTCLLQVLNRILKFNKLT
uniref:uncharacterized protein LOC100178652 isoform X2 n=1 Tax=Ciona intestinalis TaxID=7719 RepID=UPI000EF45692|nr:uncharacterized protein LOC100178652 isoform X2 [Ciona intestinalis]|eukprot:XP_026695671.1 uncharacterized protein LOC100178652 isoform X2 [Ciona intestinalis]